MTTESGAPAQSSSSTPRRIAILLIGFIAVMIALWYAGALKPRPRVAIITANEGPYWDMILRGAQDSANRYKLHLTIIRCKGDDQQQTDAIRNALGMHFDGIAISPNNPPLQAAILADVAAQTHLVTYDSDSAVAGKTCFLGTNNYDAGQMCADQIRQAVPDGGEVLLAIGSLDKENGQRRRQGVIDALIDRQFDPSRPMDPVDAPLKGAKYTIVTTLVDGLDPDKAASLAADAFKKYPNLKCAAGLFAGNTPALLKAAEQAGKLGKIQIVGFDFNTQTLDGIEAGTVFSSIMQDPYNIGREAVRVLADAAAGDKTALPMYPQFYLACDLVNKANVANVRAELAKKLTPSTRPAM